MTLTHTLYIAALLVTLIGGGSANVQAQDCAPYAVVIKTLASEYGEARVAYGVALGGQGIVEIFATPSGSTFTILIRRTDGIACAAAAGENWQWSAPPKPEDAGRPS